MTKKLIKFPYIKTTLTSKNSTIITSKLDTTASVSLLFGVKVGSRHENDKNAGISHLFEHMLFKGTKTYPNMTLISRMIEGVGGSFNAFTDNEVTGYWVKIPATEIEKGIDLLSSMLIEPILDGNELEKEKVVVNEELKALYDNPVAKVSLNIKQLIWSGHPLGRDIGGTFETISTINVANMQDFFLENYGAENIVISVVGNIVEQDVIDNLTEKCEKFNNITVKPTQQYKYKYLNPTERQHFEIREINQARVVLSFDSISANDKQRNALALFSIILGGTMSSKLFLKIREELGIVYDIYAYQYEISDCGALQISYGTSSENVVQALQSVVEVLQKCKNEPISDDDIMNAKKYLIGNMSMRLENSLSISMNTTYQHVLKKKVEQIEDIVTKIEMVTKEDIQKIACEVLDFSKFYIASVCPQGSDVKMRKLFDKYAV